MDHKRAKVLEADPVMNQGVSGATSVVLTDAQHDAPHADEEALTALFDETALVGDAAALARLGQFAAEVPTQRRPSATVLGAAASTESRSLRAGGGRVAAPAPWARDGSGQVWPIRSLWALAATLLLTMGGLTWVPTTPVQVDERAPAHARVVGRDTAVPVARGAMPAAASMITAVSRHTLTSPAAAVAAADDPLLGVGGEDWSGQIDADADIDLGDVTFDGADEEDYSLTADDLI